MGDRTACVNRRCTARSTCLRYLEVPGMRQSYSLFGTGDGRPCDKHIRVEQRDHVLALVAVDSATRDPWGGA